jgi:conjugal transfer pilus assembly protein TraA
MNFIKNPAVRKSALLVGLMTAAATASASTEGTEFQDLYDMLVGWSEGYLGKALAIAAFLTGAIVGFAKSTAMPALVGVVFAVVFSIGPGIIAGMMTAVI